MKHSEDSSVKCVSFITEIQKKGVISDHQMRLQSECSETMKTQLEYLLLSSCGLHLERFESCGNQSCVSRKPYSEWMIIK